MPDTLPNDPLHGGALIQRRGSSLQADPEPPMRSESGEIIDPFKLRVAFQNFMRENEPLFRTLASLSDDPWKMVEQGGMQAAAEKANAIALAAARLASGKGEPGPADVRPFRIAAASVAAAAWRDGRLDSLDAGAVATQLSRVVSCVDPAAERSVFADGLSQQASLSMTSLGAALRLMEPVMAYDFRRDRATLVSGMLEAVMSAAASVADAVVPAGAREIDRQSVVQTLVSCLSSLMAEVYEKKARQHVALAISLPEAEREALARRYDPVPELLRGFEDASRVFAGAALASSRLVAAAAAPEERHVQGQSRNL